MQICYISGVALSTGNWHICMVFCIKAKAMGMAAKEKEWGDRAKRFLKAELKRANIGYKELAERLQAHGMDETESGIASKLSRGTFAVAFFLACLAVLEMDGFQMADL